MTGGGKRASSKPATQAAGSGGCSRAAAGGTWAWGFLRRLPQNLKDVYSLKGEGEEDKIGRAHV